MRKSLIIALLSVVTSASAAPQHTELFSGKPEKLAARCVEGEVDATKTLPTSGPNLGDQLMKYTDYLQGLSKDRTISLTEASAKPALRVQSQYGTAFNICRYAAKNLEMRPAASSFFNGVYLYAEGTVTELKSARDWKAVLVLRDATGAEIQRFTPSSSRLGDLDDWKVSCSSSPCRYNGRNVYIFTASPELLNAVSKAAQMSFLTSFGTYGIKEYPVSLDKLTEVFGQ